MPLVSVGIATYNRPELLRQNLECLTKQTYKNLEIIVSDNCSSGIATEKIVRSFMKNDSRIQFFQQEKNKGGAYNNKFVREKAKGNFFMWSADDHFIEDNNLIEKLVLKAEKENCILTFPDVTIIRKSIQKKHMADVFKNCKTDYDYLIAWCGSGSGYPFYGLYNLENFFFAKLSFTFDADLQYFNEGIFLYKMFLCGKVRFVEDVVLNVDDRDSASAKISSPVLLDSFLKYTMRVMFILISSNLCLGKKINVLKVVFKKHRRYLWSLSKESWSLCLRSILKKLHLQK